MSSMTDDPGRFWAKVSRPAPEACWTWSAATTKGYGRVKWAGRLELAHRVSWVIAHGEIPAGLVVDHTCFRRDCVNPRHLRLISRAENSARHKPGCPCSACDPAAHRLSECGRGHDLTRADSRTKAGRCRRCQNDANRRHMRAARAAA